MEKLEHEALAAGIISKHDIRTSKAMREEAWTDYLIRRVEKLTPVIDLYNQKQGDTQ